MSFNEDLTIAIIIVVILAFVLMYCLIFGSSKLKTKEMREREDDEQEEIVSHMSKNKK